MAFNEDWFVSDETVTERDDCTLETLLLAPCMGGADGTERLLKLLLKRLRRTEVAGILEV